MISDVKKKIAILLSTYNGERYLREQLDSIFAQSYQDFILYVRDDGSTDSSVEILMEYEKNYQDKLIIIKDSEGNIGWKHSYFKMLEIVDSDYYAFCDQDDVWDSNKISDGFAQLVKLEKSQKGNNVPCCVFSDMTVVDENLNKIDDSIWHFTYTRPEYAKNIYSLIVNTIPSSGCSLMINRAVKTVGFSKGNILDFCTGHDDWATFVCAAWGGCDIIYEPKVLYRRHSSNTSDAHDYTMKSKDIIARYFLNIFHAFKYIYNKYYLLKRLGLHPNIFKLILAVFRKLVYRFQNS